MYESGYIDNNLLGKEFGRLITRSVVSSCPNSASRYEIVGEG